MRRALLAALAALAACGGEDQPDCALPPGGEPAIDPSGTFCRTLSEYRLFEDLAAQRPAAGVIPYDVNTPLFSDYADKTRFIFVPPGATIGWRDDDALALPEGTVLVKTFAYAHDRRDPALGRRLLETRLLVRGPDKWTGAAYVYDDTGDAHLAAAGATLDATWIHDDGAQLANAYGVPNKNQCKNCHAEHDKVLDTLGWKARHLNRPGPEGSGIANQLQDLVDRGVLAGAPPADMWPRAPDAMDPSTGTLDARARAWIDINCANCHNERGPARTSGLFLELAATDQTALGICKPPVAAGNGSGGRKYAIVPGRPDESIMLFRIESTKSEIKMPELGRNLVYAEGAALIRAWIAAMPGTCD
ncbi:MAG: hypothetical protein KIT31_36790 [Deltaproteobacteria bacterium]|nr:hypothetical protein [Deltaproteobacteria bacterium]